LCVPDLHIRQVRTVIFLDVEGDYRTKHSSTWLHIKVAKDGAQTVEAKPEGKQRNIRRHTCKEPYQRKEESHLDNVAVRGYDMLLADVISSKEVELDGLDWGVVHMVFHYHRLTPP
jgi:hypothetical protein